MEKMLLLVVVGLLSQGLSFNAVEVLHVEPTTPAIECPSGDSPCHTLEYYISHSSFTSNRKFVFLEGEHHFNRSVKVENVGNLSFVSASSRVKIVGTITKSLCIILFQDCFGVSIEGVVMSNCVLKADSSKPKTANDSDVEIALRNITFSSVSVINSVLLFVNSDFGNIIALNSTLIFEGSITFKNNVAHVGGALTLRRPSYMQLRPHTSILFENNHAEYVGGAIYAYSDTLQPCFYHTDSLNTVEVIFINNTANFAGSSLYMGGGCCDLCCDFHDIFGIRNTEADPSAIASDAHRVCVCKNGENQPWCTSDIFTTVHYTSAFPGQVFHLRLALVGAEVSGGRRGSGVVPEALRAYIRSPRNATFDVAPTVQASNKSTCQDFSYSVTMTVMQSVVTFTLLPERDFMKQLFEDDQEFNSNKVQVTVYVKDCPLGFALSSDDGKCVCDEVLEKADVECDINDQSFQMSANSWMGFMKQPMDQSGVIFHSNCPIGYCLLNEVRVTINTSDDQCEPNRTGLLCGKCEEGYSLTLGTEKCKKCSNTYLLILLPLAVAGLLLVAFLFALNLTVTEGDINGLIFYANVMVMSRSMLMCTNKAGYLYMFLAWLNLDLGISTCLFNGMDGYIGVWLQFVFPAYLWLIVFFIIQLYKRCPQLANRLGGKNAVKVLATLILLSYTKLQRTVVTILSFTRLEYPDGSIRHVWLYDANVGFLKGKHLYLGIAGILVLVLLVLPYTLCLAFFEQLQACSGYKIFWWVNKLKPVFDSYAGPYKDKYRFWTGMLLVARTLLIVLFTVNTAGSVDVNLLIISVMSGFLVVGSANSIYRNWTCNFIESFFYGQLVVYAAGTFYARHNRGSVEAVADASIGLSTLMFVCIMGYHVTHCVLSFKQRYIPLKVCADIEDQDRSMTHERINDDVVQ
jgi:predicted outer membrane repeat protein